VRIRVSRVLANGYGGVGVAAAAGYLLGGPIVDATSPRVAFVIVGCGFHPLRVHGHRDRQARRDEHAPLLEVPRREGLLRP